MQKTAILSPRVKTLTFSPITVAVIPAYNEEDTIGSMVLTTRLHVTHVIVVDDGSHDRTAEVARLAGADVITLPENVGKAAAVMQGLNEARTFSPAAVVVLDGDGQHSARDIPIILDPVLTGSADLVIGSRFLNGGNAIPPYRQVGQKTLDFVTNFGSPVKTTDSQSGFRALGTRALAHLDFPSEGYNIESDMFSHFVARGLTVTEVPITVKYSGNHCHKKHPLFHGVDVLGHIIGLISYRRPLIAFGTPGISLVVIGLFAGSFAFAEYHLTAKFPYLLSMVSTLFLILGLLLITSALILNSLAIVLAHQREGDLSDKKAKGEK